MFAFGLGRAALFGVLVIASMVGAGAVAQEACPGGRALDAYRDRPVTLLEPVNALVFRTDTLHLDLDGGRSTYGVDDQGLDTVCNGLSAREPAACLSVRQRGECYSACKAAFKAWNEAGADPARLKEWMGAIGLGGANGSDPDVHLQAPPRDRWFVSESAVKYQAPDGTRQADFQKTQDAYLDSETVPYFVIPGGFRKAPWDATPGDYGVIAPASNPERAVFFVIGDTGGNLDEGSAGLLEAVNGGPLPRTSSSSALGASVERLNSGLSGDYLVAIFKGTTRYKRSVSGANLVLDGVHGGDALIAEISEVGSAKLAEAGGVSALLACSQ